MWLLCLFLGRLRFSAACPAAGYPWRVLQPIWLQLAGLLLQWTFVVGLAVSWYTTWFSTLCQLSLPLAGFATFLAPVCWPTPAVEPCCWVGAVYGASLGSLPCAVLFLRGLQFAQLTLQQVPLGIFCLFCHRVPVLLLPWWRRLGGNPSLLFSVLLLLRLACRGSLGSAPCVRVLQLGLCLLFGRPCHHPACFPLPLGWVSFWSAVSTASVSCEVCSLGCPSWFVLLFVSLFVHHLLLGWGGLVTGLWPHLQLLGVGLFWGLGCAVLMP